MGRSDGRESPVVGFGVRDDMPGSQVGPGYRVNRRCLVIAEVVTAFRTEIGMPRLGAVSVTRGAETLEVRDAGGHGRVGDLHPEHEYQARRDPEQAQPGTGPGSDQDGAGVVGAKVHVTLALRLLQASGKGALDLEVDLHLESSVVDLGLELPGDVVTAQFDLDLPVGGVLVGDGPTVGDGEVVEQDG